MVCFCSDARCQQNSSGTTNIHATPRAIGTRIHTQSSNSLEATDFLSNPQKRSVDLRPLWFYFCSEKLGYEKRENSRAIELWKKWAPVARMHWWSIRFHCLYIVYVCSPFLWFHCVRVGGSQWMEVIHSGQSVTVVVNRSADVATYLQTNWSLFMCHPHQYIVNSLGKKEAGEHNKQGESVFSSGSSCNQFSDFTVREAKKWATEAEARLQQRVTTNIPDCGRWAPDRLLSSLAVWPQRAGECFFHSASLPCHTERKRAADVWDAGLQKSQRWIPQWKRWRRGWRDKVQLLLSVGYESKAQLHAKHWENNAEPRGSVTQALRL